jgi:hypothetical protein
MMRFTPGGALDGSFGNGGKVTARGIDGFGYDVRLQGDGSILVAGAGMGSDWLQVGNRRNSMTTVQTGHEAYAATFDASGRRVSSARAVHLPVVANESVWRSALAPDGKIVAVGKAFPTVYDGNPVYGDTADALVMRFDPAQFSPDEPDARDAGGGGSAAAAFSGKATVRAGRSNTFRLTFRTEAAARQADVVVTGPNGFSARAQLVKVKWMRGGGRAGVVNRLVVGATNGNNAVATFRVAAPGGRYDAADNGAYAVAVAPVGDAAGATTVGTFNVASRAGRALAARRATEVLRAGEAGGGGTV